MPFVAAGGRSGSAVELQRSGFVCVDVLARRAAYYRPGILSDELSIDVSDQIALGDFTPGRSAWVFEDVQPLAEPVPIRGRQQLFTPAADVVEQVAAQVTLAAS